MVLKEIISQVSKNSPLHFLADLITLHEINYCNTPMQISGNKNFPSLSHSPTGSTGCRHNHQMSRLSSDHHVFLSIVAGDVNSSSPLPPLKLLIIFSNKLPFAWTWEGHRNSAEVQTVTVSNFSATYDTWYSWKLYDWANPSGSGGGGIINDTDVDVVVQQ